MASSISHGCLPAASNGSGQHNASCIDSLKNSSQVHASRNFLKDPTSQARIKERTVYFEKDKRKTKKERKKLTFMRTGARRFSRSFLWTQRKLISTIGSVLERTFIVAGIAVIKPTSFPLCFTLTPKCHSRLKPGGFNALYGTPTK